MGDHQGSTSSEKVLRNIADPKKDLQMSARVGTYQLMKWTDGTAAEKNVGTTNKIDLYGFKAIDKHFAESIESVVNVYLDH